MQADAALSSFLCALRGRMRLNLPHMALRGRAVVVLIERQGGYYADVVYDACAIMWALHAAHVSPDCRSMLPWCYRVETSDCREIWCCKVAKSCDCGLLMAGLRFAAPFQHFLH